MSPETARTTLPPAVVLLAAGGGRRMLPLTERIPKALLPAGPRSVLGAMIDALLERGDPDLVVVTGHGHAAVESDLASRHGRRVRCVRNERHREDVNILSVQTGVAALHDAGRGYLICETDLLLDDRAWDALHAGLRHDRSQWICRGRYGPALTGGIVHAGADGSVDAIDYRPAHDPRFDGWDKMLGMLWVAPSEAAADRARRAEAAAASVGQYYFVPWQKHLAELACTPLRVDSGFAATFNTPAEYRQAVAAFERAQPTVAAGSTVG